MSDVLTTLLLIFGTIGAIISAIWVSWPVGVLTLVGVGILYWTREIAYALLDLQDRLSK